MQYVPRNRTGENEMNHPSASKDVILFTMEQWIMGRNAERNRAIFYDHLFRGMTYEQIAEAYDMSARQIQNVIRLCEKKVFPHVPG